MKNDELLSYINKHQLVSCMNNTKWNKLIDKITSLSGYNPRVKIKYINEELQYGFSEVWWDLVKRDGYEWIEWLEINPMVEKYRGKLIAPQIRDYSQFIENSLVNIPHEFEEGIFRIYGYLRTRK